MCLREISGLVCALDDVDGEVVASAVNFYCAIIDFLRSSNKHKSLAGLAASDVEAHIAFKVRPFKALNAFAKLVLAAK